MKYEKLYQSKVAIPDIDVREWDAKGASGNETSSSPIGSLNKKKLWFIATVLFVVLCAIFVLSKLFKTPPPTTDITSLAPPPTAAELVVDTDLQNLKTEVSTLNQSTIELREFVSNLTSRLEQVFNVIESLESNYQSVIQNYSLLEERVNQLSEAISDNTAKIPQPEVSALPPEDQLLLGKATAISSLPTNIPSFRLISVESWDGKPAATLELDGHTKVVHEGEFVANFKIINIDTLGRTIQVAPQYDITNLTKLEVGQ